MSLNALQRMGMAIANPSGFAEMQQQQQQQMQQQQALQALAQQMQNEEFGIPQAVTFAAQNPALADFALQAAEMQSNMNNPLGGDSLTERVAAINAIPEAQRTPQQRALFNREAIEFMPYTTPGGDQRFVRINRFTGQIEPGTAAQGQPMQQQTGMGLPGGQPGALQAMGQTLQGENRVPQALPDQMPMSQFSPKTRQIIEEQEAKRQMQLRADKTGDLQAMAGLAATTMDMNETIDSAISQTNMLTAGLGGSVTGMIPGSPAADLGATLNTIQADAAFDRLQEMRDASKTGGALGQVSERELALLRDARVALGQEQSPEQLRKNLQNYKRIRNRAIKAVAKDFKSAYGFVPDDVRQMIRQIGQKTVKPTEDNPLGLDLQ